jgi:hypothetical protein
LLRIPDRELVAHAAFGHLVFGQRLDDLVVDQEPVDVQELLARGVRGFELHRAAPFGILHAGQQRGLEQLRFVLQFLHDRLLPSFGGEPSGTVTPVG